MIKIYNTANNQNIQTPAFPYVLETTGNGEVTASADQVIVTIGVLTEDLDVQAATQSNAKSIQQILQALYKLGIGKQQIETEQYTIQPRYDYQDGQSHFKGYRVEHLLKITLKDVQSAGWVYDTAIKNGANIARDPIFELSNPSPIYQKALTNAYVDATQKALTLTKQMNVQLNPIPIKVVETPTQTIIPFKTQMLQSPSTPIQPQGITIQARIQVWFSYFWR